MALSEEVRQRLAALINSHDVVLFMKGNRAMPQCGFSARVVEILDRVVPDYHTVDVLADPEIRNGIKEYSSWPTVPQLYLKGEFVGGCDVVGELYASGELHRRLGLEEPERKIPNISISAAAAQRIREYARKSPGKELRLSIDAAFRATLNLAPREGNEIEAESNGVTVLMDAGTAQRAEGLSLDVTDTPGGVAFKIDNPNAPPAVKQLSATEVKRMMSAGVRFEFLDVRSPEERAIAKIDGARFLDEETAAHLEKLPKDTMLVFHCHHGGRSQEAAERFRNRGFRNVHNLAGGIDAWSLEVDPDVPRY